MINLFYLRPTFFLHEDREAKIPIPFIFQTTFKAPDGDEPLALDMGTMSKGQVWINGQSIGRYWNQYKASGECAPCNYTGFFNEKKCLSNCNESSQRW